MNRGIAASLLMLASSAFADQASMDVTSNIVGKCTIDRVSPIDFGDLTQGTTAPDRTAAGSVSYWCSKGLRYLVTVGYGANSQFPTRRMKGQDATNSTEYLSYDLTPRLPQLGTGLGPAAPQRVDMEASIKGRDYNTLSVGGLLDTVVVTIIP